MKYVGIDLGTTNSAISSYDSESVRLYLYKSPQQHDVTPSAIFFDKRGSNSRSPVNNLIIQVVVI